MVDMSAYGIDAQEDVLDTPAHAGDGLAHATFAYFREGRVITLLLLGTVYLILALSLNGAGWTGAMSMGLLIYVVLGALAMGALMAFSRFDSFFMLSHSFATGLAWVFYLMTFLVGEEPRVQSFSEKGIPVLQARAYFLLEQWLDWIEAAINQQANNDNIVFIFEIGFLVWWLTYLGVWSVFRHGHVWRGVLMAGVALLVNTHYAPTSVMGFLVTYCIAAAAAAGVDQSHRSPPTLARAAHLFQRGYQLRLYALRRHVYGGCDRPGVHRAQLGAQSPLL